MSNSTTIAPTEAPVADDYVPTFANMQFVMLTTMFVSLVLLYDLHDSLVHISNKKTHLLLKISFIALAFFYVAEFFLTMGTVIDALCPAALWLLGICHYSIKVIVSYTYCTRTEIAMKGNMHFSGGMMKKVLNGLQALIIFTAVSNLAKVFAFYKSFRDGAVCVYDLGGFWGYLDEIMFGAIDLATLAMLAYFYFHTELNEATSLVIQRILYMSSVTMFATVFAVIVNVADPGIGLAASILDISTDIITLMKVYTLPRTHARGANGTRISQHNLHSNVGSTVGKGKYSAGTAK